MVRRNGRCKEGSKERKTDFVVLDGLGRIREEDASSGLGLRDDALDQNSVPERTKSVCLRHTTKCR